MRQRILDTLSNKIITARCLPKREDPLSRLLHESLEGIGETGQSRAVEMAMVTDPANVHDWCWCELHLLIVPRQNHRSAGRANHCLAVEEDGPRVLRADDADVR